MIYWCVYFLAIIINKHNKTSYLALHVIIYNRFCFINILYLCQRCASYGFATAVVFIYNTYSVKYNSQLFPYISVSFVCMQLSTGVKTCAQETVAITLITKRNYFNYFTILLFILNITCGIL